MSKSLIHLTDRVWVYPYEQDRDRPNLGYVRGDRLCLAVDAGHSDDHIAGFYAALEAGCQLALFGHTHTPFHEDIGGVKVVNPGTAGKGRSLTWALLTVYDNGGIGVEMKTLEHGSRW